MKKSIYLLVILGTLIAGCSTGAGSISNNSGSVSENNTNTDFSFLDLRLNLNGINRIGVSKNVNNPLGRKQSSVPNQTQENESYLVGYNDNGDEIPLDYLDSDNVEVEVPYSVFSLEVIGDFSYIVYYNSNITTGLSSLESTLYYDYGPWGAWSGKSLGMTNFEILLKTFGPHTEGNPGAHAFIISHNESGKLFDAVVALSMGYFDDGNMQLSVDLQLLTLFDDKIVYFKNSFPETDTCRGELVFDASSNTLTKTEVCTPLYIKPIFTHYNGYFVYTFNNEVSFASPDFSITGDLTKYFTSTAIQRNTVFKSVGENIVMITNLMPSSFVVFNSNFEVLEEKTDELERGYYLVEVYWLFNKNGFDYFNSNSIIHYVNFETFEYGIVDFNDQFPPLNQFSQTYKYLVFDNNLYQIGSKIQTLGINNVFITLESNVFEIKGDFTKILTDGYVQYSQVSGLSQINKYLNLQTGEIYLESESRPTITVTQVQLIN